MTWCLNVVLPAQMIEPALLLSPLYPKYISRWSPFQKPYKNESLQVSQVALCSPFLKAVLLKWKCYNPVTSSFQSHQFNSLELESQRPEALIDSGIVKMWIRYGKLPTIRSHDSPHEGLSWRLRNWSSLSQVAALGISSSNMERDGKPVRDVYKHLELKGPVYRLISCYRKDRRFEGLKHNLKTQSQGILLVD